jgi:uncharacterized delta-60 repeat protein
MAPLRFSADIKGRNYRGQAMKKKTTITKPLFNKALIPAAITSALVSPLTLAAPGDLDPAFGDVGRLGPILDGAAWSVEPQLDGTLLLGGGDPGYLYWGDFWGEPGFVRMVSASGVIDPALAAFDFGAVQVVDATRQPDGMVVAVGRELVSGESDTRLSVARLGPDGSRDLAFGPDGNGWFQWSTAAHGYHHGATSVVLDPDGRIVVAGSRDDNLVVLRLLPDGMQDESFGTAGIFEGPVNLDFSTGQAGARTNILRTPGGGYRVTTAAPEGCQVVALTAAGNIDGSFGDAGIATIVTSAGSTAYCTSMDAQPDGRLLVAGSGNGLGFAARLLENGQLDPGFSANAVPATVTEATAVATDGNAAVVVAGVGDNGMSIMRLTADGGLDATFGNAGITTFDVQSEESAFPVVNDLFVMADRRIVGAGGICFASECEWSWSNGSFVFRLFGHGGSSPGVLGISEQFNVPAEEADGEVVLNVRRTGGRSGSVSVDWQTATVGWEDATPGADYTAVSGSLTWADGDMAPQQIRVPILTDDTVEGFETFQVVLSDLQDGAGLGKSRATVVISPDGAPHGQFGFSNDLYVAAESIPAKISVFREYYSTGIVSVTVTPVSGTALAGVDFVADPVTLTWADGETGWKDATIPLINDTSVEPQETFTIELSSPSGGAIIGPHSSMTVRIAANDRPVVVEGSSSGGSGAFGLLSLLLLGVVRLLRRVIAGPAHPRCPPYFPAARRRPDGQ